MNVAALLLLGVLFARVFSPLGWLIVFVGSSVIISAALLSWVDGFAWYVGLSGVLHGVLAAALLAGWRQRRIESLLLGAGLTAKLVYEFVYGALPGSATTAGGPVLTEAHLFGVLGGLLTGAALVRLRRL